MKDPSSKSDLQCLRVCEHGSLYCMGMKDDRLKDGRFLIVSTSFEDQDLESISAEQARLRGLAKKCDMLAYWKRQR